MKRFLLLILALMAVLVAAPAASALTINVTTAADSYGGSAESCSLREAITAAQTNSVFDGCPAGSGSDVIALPAGDYRITRAGADEDLNVTGDFDVTGPNALTIEPVNGTAKVSVSGNGLDRVFDQQGNNSLSLRNLQVREGKLTGIGDDGGGIRNGVGKLTLEGITVNANTTLYSGGGIAVYDQLSMINSTISGNSAGQSGGGLYLPGSAGGVRSSTITANTADSDANGSGNGGGFADVAATSVSFLNTVNAANHDLSPGEKAADCASGPFYFPDYVIQTQAFAAGNCLIGFNPATLIVGDPLLGSLGDNGGQTPTHAPLEGSPAIGTGGPSGSPDECPAVDQTGRERDIESCDIGAVQYVVPAPPLKVVVKIAKVKPKVLRLKRGKKAKTTSVVVKTVGMPGALNTRLCLKPNRTIRKALRFRGKRCHKVGTLVGRKTVRFRIAAKKNAKKRTYKVKAVLTATDAVRNTRSITVKVK